MIRPGCLRRPWRTGRRRLVSSSSSSPSAASSHHHHHPGGGIGLHNVHDQLLPSAIPAHHSPLHRCSIIGVPMTQGQPYVGVDDGPALLRASGLVDHLQRLSWQVHDLGDLDLSGTTTAGPEAEALSTPDDETSFLQSGNVRVKNPTVVGAGTHLLAQTVYEQLQQTGTFPLILGGDHSIAIGSLAALLRHNPDTGIIWIDAHADINTPWISESGNLHGMPIGLLLDPIQSSQIPGFGWLQDYCPPLDPRQIAYVGLRDVDAAERRIILDHNIAAFTMHEIDRYGIGQVMEMVLNVHLKDRPLHMSYDIDAVDPILAPATGTAVRGGLTFREAHYVAEAAAPRLLSAEIVELNPTRAPNPEGADDTIELGLHIISSMMGKSII